jgi:hypothetical protein
MLCLLAKSTLSLGSREKGSWHTTLSLNPAGGQTSSPASVYAPRSSRSATVSETSINAAMCTFFSGIAGEEQLAYNLCPPTRRVAEHLFLLACLIHA